MTQSGEIDYQKVLDFWFGSVEETVIPSEHRARVWFGDNPKVDAEMRREFLETHEMTINGQLDSWRGTAHGELALVLLLDQFSRHLYRNTEKAFRYDHHALMICSEGIESNMDHELSLIERVFFYFPLLHSEELQFQELSVRCYHMLVDLALPETRVVYESFLRFANHHHGIIKRFGRFPQRNEAVGRTSTEEELTFLSEQGDA